MDTTTFLNLQKNELLNNTIVNLYENYDSLKFEEFSDSETNKNNIVNTYNDKKIISKENFLIKKDLYCHKTFELLENINNCIFAGGGLFNILADYVTEQMEKSDIDIFFFGDYGKQVESVRKILHKSKKYGAKFYKSPDINSFVEIHIPYQRTIQLITTEHDNPEEIIKNFDLNYDKIFCYKNQKFDIYLTMSALMSLKYWANNALETKSQKILFRYNKTIKKGLRLVSHSLEKINFEENNYKKLNLIEVTNINEIQFSLNYDYIKQKMIISKNKSDINIDDLILSKPKKFNIHSNIYAKLQFLVCGNQEIEYCQSNLIYEMEIKNVYYEVNLFSEIYSQRNTIYIILDEKESYINDLEKINNKFFNNLLIHNYKNKRYIRGKIYLGGGINIGDEIYKDNQDLLHKYEKKKVNIFVNFRIIEINKFGKSACLKITAILI